MVIVYMASCCCCCCCCSCRYSNPYFAHQSINRHHDPWSVDVSSYHIDDLLAIAIPTTSCFQHIVLNGTVSCVPTGYVYINMKVSNVRIAGRLALFSLFMRHCSSAFDTDSLSIHASRSSYACTAASVILIASTGLTHLR